MSPLNDLHRRLYSHGNEDLIRREKSPDEFNSEEQEIKKAEETKPKKEDLVIDQIERESVLPKVSFLSRIFNKQNNKKFLIGTGVILTVTFLVIGYIKFKQKAFSQENIAIEFQGEESVKSGEVLEYKLLIKNKNWISLKNSQIQIKYPQEVEPIFKDFMRKNAVGSFYIDIGKMKSLETKEYLLEFKVFSPRENQVYLNTDFRYEPSNFSSVFSKAENHSFVVRGSVVDFSLVSQQEASSGELVKFVAVLNNNTEKSFDDLILKLDYPEGFNFSNSSLEKIDENSFRIPKLEPKGRLELEIFGNFEGAVNSVKKMTGTVGNLNDKNELSKISLAEETVKVIPSRISITQEFLSGTEGDSQITYLGQAMRVKITFRNNSTYPLSDLVLKEKIDTDLIDHFSLKSKFGFYDENKQEIVWRASDISTLKNLNPGESGSVEYDFTLKDNFIPQSDKTNQSVRIQARISSTNINSVLPENQEVSSSWNEARVKTNLDILTTGEFKTGVFKNTGSIPLKINEETTLTVKLRLRNDFNRIENPKLTIKLPSGIIWKNSFQRSSGEVIFNERSNELVWSLKALNPRVGYAYPFEEIIFQVGVTPQSSQIGRDFKLLNEIIFSGFEKYVEKNIYKKIDGFNLSSVSDYEF